MDIERRPAGGCVALSDPRGLDMTTGQDAAVTLLLCGDVMLGRGVDQILPYPGDPRLWERYVRDARGYVALAEAVNGPIPRPVGAAWPWGDALDILDAAAPDLRLVNLETSITRSGDVAAGKAVHYRMNPANIATLAVARPDVCVLANNHVMDFGRLGLAETLDTLAVAGLRTVGAGRDAEQAWCPAAVGVGADRRVLVVAFATPSSGVPPTWAATGERAGVAFVPELCTAAADEITARVRPIRRPGDVVVASVHWGSNWGYHVDGDQVRFAHHLVDGGIDVVYGHSSHHPRPIEVYRNRLILYGCGDLVDDYEGITGHEYYRDDLRLLYLATVDARTGELSALSMTPLQARRMCLYRASRDDARWLRTVLSSTSREFGVQVAGNPDGTLALRWSRDPAVPHDDNANPE
jgi:poly-gamma-glutamate synthesis protein (capsule biosynthesis protein)